MKIPTLPTIPPDKLGHYLYGSIASVAGVLVARYFGVPGAVGALCAALLVGLLKDVVIDKMLKRGTFDPRDIVATAAGGIPAAVASAI